MHIAKVMRHFSPLTGMVLVASALGLLAPVPASAALIVSFGSSIAAAGSNQFVDVLLHNTGSAVTVDVFSFDFSTSSPYITFTEATTSTTTAPYIFAGNSLFGPIVSTTPPPNGQTVIASDLAVCCGTVVGPNSTFALGEVEFQTAAGAPSGSAILVLNASGTSLSDSSGNLIPITTLTNGSITVTASAVPEPSTLSMLTPLTLFLVAVGPIRRGLAGRGSRRLARLKGGSMPPKKDS